MKKSNLIILLVIAAVTIAWTTSKKRKAGPLILKLDEGEFLPDQPNEATKKMFDI
jgi:lipopolysaccharide export system protein LptC